MEIKVNNLYKSFKKVTIVNGVNITFSSGKVYGIIGQNGSGKSVFLKLLCGFYVPDSGEIYFDGIKLDAQYTYPKSTRALIENPDFIPELTGFQNLKLLASIQKTIDDEQILDAMKIVNIYNEKDKKFGNYSLGMKQKLGLAQVIMENPDVMFFDEPLNGIEEDTAQEFRKYIQKIKKDKIIIVASHIRDDIEYLCDEVYKFQNGQLVKDEEK